MFLILIPQRYLILLTSNIKALEMSLKIPMLLLICALVDSLMS